MNARYAARRCMYEQGLPCTVLIPVEDATDVVRMTRDLHLAAKDLGEKVDVSVEEGPAVITFTMARREEKLTPTQARHAEIKKWGGASNYAAHVRQRRDESATGVFMVRHFGYTPKQAHKRITQTLHPEVIHVKSLRPDISEVTIL